MEEQTGRTLLIAWWAYRDAPLFETDTTDRFAMSAYTSEECAFYEHARSLEEDVIPKTSDWCITGLTRRFGNALHEEAAALRIKAAFTVRANTLKTSQKNLKKIYQDTEYTVYSPIGLVMHTPLNIQQDTAYRNGDIEIQDEAAQIASYLVDAQKGHKIADLCAGAGGKALLIASLIENKGEITCFDIHENRLKNTKIRAKRAGAKSIHTSVLPQSSPERTERLAPYSGKEDRVIIDAPCSGTGTWRRSPDLQLRYNSEKLDQVCAVQHDLLQEGAALVKAGGRLVYMTCSLLPEENEDQVSAFLAENPDFRLLDYRDVWSASGLCGQPAQTRSLITECLCLTPAQHGTDGFFVALMERAS